MKTCKNLSKRGLALFLALVMCLSMVQITAFAVDGHVHNEDGWSCTQDDSVRELSCDKHVHNDNCYQTVQGELTCEAEEHQHGDGCYEAAEPQLTCADAEHTHGDSCYTQGEDVLTCAETEHTHGEDCYAAETVKVCEEEDHQHGDECYTVTEGEWTCTAPVVEEAPAEVQAFLDAAAELPDASEVTAENAEEIGEQVSAVLDLYEAIGTETDEVAEALNTVYAVYAAVDAALELDTDTLAVTASPYKDKFPNGVVGYAENPVYGTETRYSGDTFVFSTLPTRQITGGWYAGTYYPDAYYYELKSVTDSKGIVKNISYSVDSWTGNQGTGRPCFSVNIDTNEDVEGTATVDVLLVYYIRELKGLTIQTGERLTGYFSRHMICTVTVTPDPNKPDHSDTTYTVVYTDGVSGEVFGNESHSNLKEDDATPAFTGSTEREGYTFMGWAPTVNSVVSAEDANENGEIIYTATWTKDNTPPPTENKPEAPTKDDVENSLKEEYTDSEGKQRWASVRVYCEPGRHLVGYFSANKKDTDRVAIGEVKGNDTDGYTCDVTFLAQAFCVGYSKLKSCDHTLVAGENGQNKTIVFNWNAETEKWEPAAKGVVKFWTECAETTKPETVTYKVQWIDEAGSKVLKTEERKGTIGTTVSVAEADKSYTGYTYVGDEDSRNVLSDTLDNSNVVLKMYFRKNGGGENPGPGPGVEPDKAGLKLTKSVDNSKPDLGGTVTYTITVSNETKVALKDLKIKDVMPEGVTLVEGSGKVTVNGAARNVSLTQDGQTCSWTVDGVIPVDGKVILTYNATVPGAAAEQITLTNTAQAFANQNEAPAPRMAQGVAQYAASMANDFVSGSDSSNVTVVLPGKYDFTSNEDNATVTVKPGGGTEQPGDETPKIEAQDLQQVGVMVRCADNASHDSGAGWWQLGGKQKENGLRPWFDTWRTIGAVEKVDGIYQCVVTLHAVPWADLRINGATLQATGIKHVFNETKTGGKDIPVRFTYVDGVWTTDTKVVTVWLKELKPEQNGTWQLDITKQISNYGNQSGKPVLHGNLPADFAIDVTVEYHNGTERVSETKTLKLADNPKTSYDKDEFNLTDLTWLNVFQLPDWQYDFAGTGKTEADLADYNTVITITEKNYNVDGYTCTVKSIYKLDETNKLEGATNTVIYEVEQSGVSNHIQSRYGLRNTYTAPAPDAKDTTYTVVHEYYTNGALTGSNQDTMNGKVGQTVNAEEITKVTTFGGNSYTYTSANPEILVLADSENTITLRYDRTTGGNGGGNGGGTTRYTLTVRYEYEDGTQAAPTHTERLARGDAYSVDSPVIEGYIPDQAVVSGEMPGRSLTVTVVYTPEGQDIPDEEPPLVDLPDEEPPLVNIPEEEPPLVEIPEEEPPLAETPLDPTPKTGDNSRTGLWAALCGFSLFGMLALLGKKREDEEA
ncbi:MucBP domain-containing protein [Oscillospiraceae bacterium 44-34]